MDGATDSPARLIRRDPLKFDHHKMLGAPYHGDSKALAARLRTIPNLYADPYRTN